MKVFISIRTDDIGCCIYSRVICCSESEETAKQAVRDDFKRIKERIEGSNIKIRHADPPFANHICDCAQIQTEVNHYHYWDIQEKEIEK